jgi:hypothetical protein
MCYISVLGEITAAATAAATTTTAAAATQKLLHMVNNFHGYLSSH